MDGHYAIGDIVLGSWTLVKQLGQGSFGRVYEAHREDFGVTYKAAIKIITIPYDRSELYSARAEGMSKESIIEYYRKTVSEIVQEFALMSRLKGSSNIVSYEDHAVIEHSNGIGWDVLIRMELLEPMLVYMNAHQMTRRDIIHMGIDVCKALELCQKYNIIHRDIKPENMFISELGEFKLGDFGIARTVEKTTGGLSKKGTYTYMAPEVYREDVYGTSVDIYSLGIVMYRLLNYNRAPFLPLPPSNISHNDRELALIRRVSGEALPMPANAEGRLAEIVLKACAYNPKERYSSPLLMRRELEAILYAQQEDQVIYGKSGAIEIDARDYKSLGEKQTLSAKPIHCEDGTTQIPASVGTERKNRTSQRKYDRSGNFVLTKNRKKNKSKRLLIASTVIPCIILFAFGIGILSARISGLRDFTSAEPDEIKEGTNQTLEAADSAETQMPIDQIVELATIVTDSNISTLNQYKSLKKLDLTGSICYPAIHRYQQEHPNVEVLYSVNLGKQQVKNTEQKITLMPNEFDYETLSNNLQYLPKLKAVNFNDLALNGGQMMKLRELYPDIVFDYSVKLFGEEIDLDQTSLDLSKIQTDQIPEAVEKLGLLPNLTTVQLNNALPMTAVAELQNANPNAAFQYSFSLFGKSLSTSDTYVEFKDQNIGNESAGEIRLAMEILDSCERLVLDNCGIDYDTLANIRKDFPNGPRLVWRVQFGVDDRYNALTDDEVIRAVYNVTDDTSHNLQYCNGVKYLDISHNEMLSNLSFLGYMPNLEVVIASGSPVSELSGLENCRNLTWLELCYCQNLFDITCLSECNGLEYLNISYTNVQDISALETLPLKRFVSLSPQFSTDDQKKFMDEHPECLTVFTGDDPYLYGWRYDDYGKTFDDYYKNVVRAVFNYDSLETLLPDS